jgi:ABC-type antimicrobial peptide transport system permease subunit
MVLRQGVVLTTVGLTVGIGGAVTLSRFLESLRFGIAPTDAMTYVAVSALLAVVAIAACYLPARRASAADPMETLRVE